jgi:hypothetical protein
MRIDGKWIQCADGATRPLINAAVEQAGGGRYSEFFLLDRGADVTVFSAAVLQHLNLPPVPPPPGYRLVGVGGSNPSVLVDAVVKFRRSDGVPARVRGRFAGFTAPSATDYSILGRDVTGNFDVILSRRRGDVLLLAPNHHYQIVGS